MHFHVMIGPSPLGSDGIPYVFDSFVFHGLVPDEEFLAAFDGAGVIKIPDAGVESKAELPLDQALVSFPAKR